MTSPPNDSQGITPEYLRNLGNLPGHCTACDQEIRQEPPHRETASRPIIPPNDIDKQIDEALHPERNGLLIKRGIAEGANHEHIVKESLKTLIADKERLARISELEYLRDSFVTPDKGGVETWVAVRTKKLSENS